MNNLFIAMLLACFSLLSGCNGSSGSNDEPIVQEDPVVSNITIALVDTDGNSQQSFVENSTITLQAKVVDQFGQPSSGKRVNFSIDLGSLSVPSSLTNADGIAETNITNEEEALSAGTASATIDEFSANIDYEYINSGNEVQKNKISTQLLLDSTIVNQFKANQQVQIVVNLTDANNLPINGSIIEFTADVGQLNTTTALTINGTATVTLSGNDAIGAGIVTATLTNDETIFSQINYQIVSADAIIDEKVRLGYFDTDGSFIEGLIKLSVPDNTISAGGTLGLTVNLVDNDNNRINSPTPVTFTSNCVSDEHANIDETVFSINGTVSATFEDIDCAGTSGTDDVIIASVTVNGITSIANQTITITGEQLGSIEFVTAEPAQIVLKGTGGQGKQETSTLTFRVKSALGNLLPQQEVEFSLDTAVGGIILSRTSGLTNSQGLITTQVIAGSVPTAVRVTAQSSMTVDNNEIMVQTQSDLLSINTGLPEQRSFTLGATILNPEGNFNGETSVITARLADNFNNPVPDGTTVNFTTEGGVIEPTCSTLNGACSVTWTSAEPRIEDHRSTILATAIGHESFFDTNGNNTFDDNDGSAIVDIQVSSGFDRHFAEPSGFIDMSEAWRDDNRNHQYDSGELFLDFNNNQQFDSEDGKFNGPQCEGNSCADEAQAKIHVRKALELVMSSSDANYSLTNSDTQAIYYDTFGEENGIPDIADGNSLALTFSFADSAEQTLPVNTDIAVELSYGDLAGTTNVTVANTNAAGYSSIDFTITNPVDTGGEPGPGIGTLTITITTPKGVVTSLVRTLNLL